MVVDETINMQNKNDVGFAKLEKVLANTMKQIA